MKEKLKSQLFLFVFLNMLITIIVFGFIYYDTSVGLAGEKASAYLQLTNENKVEFINDFFSRVAGSLKILVENELLTNQPIADSDQYRSTLRLLQSFYENETAIEDYYAGYDDSFLIVNDWTPPEDYDHRARPWYRDAKKKAGHVVWGDLYQDAEKDRLTISASLEVKDAEDKSIGVVGADCNLSSLNRMIDSATEYTSGKSFVLDGSGKILIHPDENIIGTSANNEAFFQKADADSGAIEYTYEKNLKMAYYNRIDSTDWILYTVVTKNEIFKPIIKNTIKWLILIIFLNLLVSFCFAYLLGKRIAEPIINLDGLVGLMAEGDLTNTSNISSSNEIGRLSGKINKFVGILRNIIHSMKDVSTENIRIKNLLLQKMESSQKAVDLIGSHVSEGKLKMEQLEDGVAVSKETTQRLSISLNNLDEQMGEQATAVEESSAAVEEMVASLKNVAEIVARKKETTGELVQVAVDGGGKLKETGRMFKEGIADRIDDITGMLRIIEKIAAMTNLLSMNAAIEAAHAGDAGKGFAVVADEIRKMAETSSDNARSINAVIKEIIESIHRTEEFNITTNQAFDKIEQEVEEFSHALFELSASMQQLSAGGEQVLGAISTLNRVSTEVKDSTRNIKEGQNQLLSRMEEINSFSGNVSANITGIAERTDEIISAMQEVGKTTTELGETAECLNHDVNKFKT